MDGGPLKMYNICTSMIVSLIEFVRCIESSEFDGWSIGIQ